MKFFINSECYFNGFLVFWLRISVASVLVEVFGPEDAWLAWWDHLPLVRDVLILYRDFWLLGIISLGGGLTTLLAGLLVMRGDLPYYLSLLIPFWWDHIPLMGDVLVLYRAFWPLGGIISHGGRCDHLAGWPFGNERWSSLLSFPPFLCFF